MMDKVSVQSTASTQRRRLGKYDLCAKLGSGGQAEVYLALMRGHAGFNKLVVIKKLIADGQGDDPMRVSRFLDEARLAARLNHPNIVDTYEIGEDGGEYFIAMEYLEGQPLNRVARNSNVRKIFTPAMWARLASEALRGLGYAHNLADYNGTPLGIVHRDISPDNVFLTYDGEIKIVDFGVAKALLNNEKTEIGIVKGKISYMAPEQVRGKADHRADLFSMGVLLWVILTGRRLFDGEPAAVLYQLMTDPIPGLATVLPDIHPLLAATIDRALRKDPALRFQTAEEMRDALEEFIRASGESVSDIKLGKVVRETFAETRQRVQHQVQEAISRAVPSNLLEIVAEQPPRSLLPEIGSVTPSQELTGTLPPLVDAHGAQAQANRRRSVLLAMLGAVIVGISMAIAITRDTRDTEEQPGTTISQAAMLAPVEITSEPPGARVELNGVELGRTPGRFELEPGPHTLIVTLDAHDAQAIVVEATISPTAHRIVLKPKSGTGAPEVVTPKDNDALSGGDVSKAGEVAMGTGPPVAPALPQRQRRSPLRGITARPGAKVVSVPEPKEEALPAAVILNPQIKVIEDDPKQTIEVLND